MLSSVPSPVSSESGSLVLSFWDESVNTISSLDISSSFKPVIIFNVSTVKLSDLLVFTFTLSIWLDEVFFIIAKYFTLSPSYKLAFLSVILFTIALKFPVSEETFDSLVFWLTSE